MSNFWKALNKPFTALAPMEEVTDFVFREIVSTIAKPDILYTEFTCTDALVSKGAENVMIKLKYSEIQRPIVAQIWGSKPENFYQIAQKVQELGFDGVDINMGCPDKQVVKIGGGASLINNNSLVSEIITAVKKGAPDLPLSIKTRLALSHDNTIDWLTFLLSQNLSAITLHARDITGLPEEYANWEEIGNLVNLKNKISPETIIIGNGDVKSYAEVLEKHEKYKVDGVMIGRGIFHNPWIFNKKDDLENHTTKERINLLLKHAQLYEQTWGKTKNFEILKKFVNIYIKQFNGADDLRKKLMLSKSYSEFYEILS